MSNRVRGDVEGKSSLSPLTSNLGVSEIGFENPVYDNDQDGSHPVQDASLIDLQIKDPEAGYDPTGPVSQSTNGDGRVSYEKLEISDPVRRLDSTKRAVYKEPKQRMSSILQTIPHKVTFTRRKHISTKCAAMVLVLLVLLVAIAVGIYFVVDHNRHSSRKPIDYDSSCLRGSFTVLNHTFNAAYSDKSSSEFQQLASEIIPLLNGLYLVSNSSYNSSFISSFSPGSVRVEYYSMFNDVHNASDLEYEAEYLFLSQSLLGPGEDLDFYIGDFLIKRSSISFNAIPVGDEPFWRYVPPGPKVTSPAVVTTTTTTTASTSMEVATAAATVPLTTSTTTKKPGRCRSIYPKECSSPSQVLYNTTAFPNLFGHTNQSMAINAFSQAIALSQSDCHPYAKRFTCGLYLPPCTEDSLQVTEDIPLVKPCRGFCRELMHKCMTVIPSQFLSIHCDSFPEEDSGTECISAPPIEVPPIRLVGGLGPYEGRVEVLHDGQWGTICDDGWSDLEATVVCKQLNYTGRSVARSRAFFGAGTGPVWMNNVNCDGTSIERHLGLCGQTDFSASHVCQHQEDAGVTCDVDSIDLSSIDIQLRLSDGPSPREGRLEIFYNETWGTVCEDGFRDREAVVACHSLGYENADVSYGRNWDGKYPASNGPVWLDRGLECLGYEQHIALCEHSGWGQSNCDHTGDVILSCLPEQPTLPPQTTVTPGLQVRLTDGEDSSAGRLEVLFNGTWGTVCRSLFDEGMNKAVDVACGMLNYTGGQYELMRYGAGEGQIWLDNVVCNGTESDLSECLHDPWGHSSDCTHDDDVSISCYDAVLTTYLPSLSTPDVQQPLSARLVDGPSTQEGRLEVQYRGTWGTVCDDDFDDHDAAVFCRMLGFNGSARFLMHMYGAGEASAPVLMDNVDCRGNETSATECAFIGLGEKVHCLHSEDVSIACASQAEQTDSEIPLTTTPSLSLSVRLQDGPSAMEGRVEVLFNAQWGTVCDDSFDDEDASVVCSMLGFSGPAEHLFDQHGSVPTAVPIWLEELQCTGNESSLLQCPYEGLSLSSTIRCSHSEDVSVRCSIPTTPAAQTTIPASHDVISVALLNGSSPSEGRLMVQYNGVWGSVCGSKLGRQDVNVFCRLMGYNYGGEPLGHLYGSAEASEPIWLNEVECEGGESSITQCGFMGLGRSDPECMHSDDVSIKCFTDPVTTPTPTTQQQIIDGQLRLHGGATETEGWLEIYHDGRWGRICGEPFRNRAAVVACNSLGMSGNALVVAGKESSVNEEFPMWISEVECNGDEGSLLNCSYYGFDEESCFDHTEDVYLQCNADVVPVRLEGGSHDREGRVEVFYQGRWGTICNEEFDEEDAQVICRSLGFSVQEAKELKLSNIAVGEGDIWLESLDCLGTESTLMQCDHDGWGEHNCGHREDVRVSCGHPPTSAPPDLATTESNMAAAAAPTFLASSNSSLTIQWQSLANPEILGCVIEYQELGSAEILQVRLNDTKQTNYTITELDTYTTYAISMACFTSTEQGPRSPSLIARTDPSRPTGAPPGVHTSALNSSALTVWWLAPLHDDVNGELLGYKIRVYDVTAGVMRELVVRKEESHSPAVFTVEFGGLQMDTEYNVTVLFFTAQGDGPQSEALSVRTDLAGVQCEVIHIPMCQHNRLSYNATLMPNYFGHVSQDEATQYSQQWQLAITLQCHANLQAFLCLLYAPPCPVNTNTQPCRSECLQIHQHCSDLFWPVDLHCDSFGDHNCLDDAQLPSTESHAEPTDATTNSSVVYTQLTTVHSTIKDSTTAQPVLTSSQLTSTSLNDNATSSTPTDLTSTNLTLTDAATSEATTPPTSTTAVNGGVITPSLMISADSDITDTNATPQYTSTNSAISANGANSTENSSSTDDPLVSILPS